MIVKIPGKMKLSVAIGILIAMSFLVIVRLIFAVNGENEYDSFYHVRIAMEGWRVYAAKTFPTLILSTWTECFADKELLFHILLGWVQNAVLALGLPEFPFHIPNLFFLFLMVSAFAVAGMRYRVRGLCLCIPFLFCICPYFTFRAMMLRPHLLAITLMLLSCAVYPSIRTLKDSWKALLLGIVFAWAYSNPHFLLFSTGAFAFAYFLKDKKRGVLLFVSTVIGLLFGFLLHPQNPNTFINWKIQCIDVLMILYQSRALLPLGSELTFTGVDVLEESLLVSIPLCAIFLGNIGLSIYLFFRKREIFFRPEILALILLALLTQAGFLAAFRFIEYAMPLNLLLFGVLCSRVIRIRRRRRRLALLSCTLLLCLGALLTSYHLLDGMETFTNRPATHLAKWFASFGNTVPKNLVIGNLNWSDFPQLYYAMPHMRYLCGLDPTFGYIYKEDITLKMVNFWRRKLKIKPKVLAELIGTPLFFLGPNDYLLAKDMYESGYRMIYLGVDGRLFTSLGHWRPPPEKTSSSGKTSQQKSSSSPKDHK